MLYKLRRIWTKTNDGPSVLPLQDTAVTTPAFEAAQAAPGFVRMGFEQTANQRIAVFEFCTLEGAKAFYRMHMDDDNKVFSRYRAAVFKKAAEVGTTYNLSWMLTKMLSILPALFVMVSGALASDRRFIIPSPPAATFDQVGRLFARHMDYVPQNVPGASGMTAANALYRATPDGSTIGIVHSAAIQAQALDEPAAQFDAAKFKWVGTPTRDTGTLVVWHTSKVRTFKDLLTTGVTIGVSNIRLLAYTKLANQVLGTKFKIVRGYANGAHITLALERGEIDGSLIFPWSQYVANCPDWVRDYKIIPIAQTGINRDPALPQVPLMTELSPIFAPLAAIDAVGRPLALPPGTPDEVVGRMRSVFDHVTHSPIYLEDAKRIGMDASPMSGAELARVAADVLGMSAETKALLKGAID
jgi:tripartite-type tricarboxylate transporter receptor subunit TctC